MAQRYSCELSAELFAWSAVRKTVIPAWGWRRSSSGTISSAVKRPGRDSSLLSSVEDSWGKPHAKSSCFSHSFLSSDKPRISSCIFWHDGPNIRPDCPAEGPVKVADLIGSRKEVFSITEETSVHQAAQYLREKQVRSVGVMNAGGKLVGVISHSDVSDKVAAENKCPAWMKASDIMTRELVTVTPDKTLEDCLRLMEQNTIFHLLVVDEGQVYRGMLSVSDILRVVASDEKARGDLLEAFIFPPR